MTRWAKDATKFTVKVRRNGERLTSSSYIPRPILRMLGDPDRITFTVRDGTITVSSADGQTPRDRRARV